MKDKEVLNMLTKEELIKVILEFNDRAFMGYVRKRLIAKSNEELVKILDKQQKVNISTLAGAKVYYDLEQEYKVKQAVFDKLCGIK